MEKTPTRWWDTPSAIFLFLLVLFSAWRVQVADWTEGLNLVRNLALLGLFLGLALGQSKFQIRTVILLSLAYMFVLFTWQWLRFIEFSEEQTYLGEQLLILFSRILTNISEFFAGREVQDQFFVMALLCFPYWLVGLYSGYQMTRHANVLACVLPAGALMFFIHNYHYTTKNYSWMFGVYLFVMLLMVSRQKFIKDKIKWAKERVAFSQESSIDITTTSLYVSFALILFVWLVPYTLPSRAEARETWQKTFGDWFSGERFENLFPSINQEQKPVSRNFQSEFSLGTQTSLSDAIVFQVYVPPSVNEFPRLYWRGQVYDYFENDHWLLTNVEELAYRTSTQDLNIADVSNRSRFTFTFDVYSKEQSILYHTAEPIWINQNATILYSPVTLGNEEMDVVTVRASSILRVGDLYHVSAMMANPAVSELREAGQAYPTWVKEKYLQLPEDFSARIRELAFEITAGHDTPYDQATAITNYLRNEISYAPSVASVAESEDALEYFLFTSKSGFCNYYATAQVLMLRAVGIPARLAVGYAQGEANIQSTIYTVRERNLHAWPEVYFPGYGWIEFEPTINQAVINRPLEHEETDLLLANEPIEQTLPEEELEAMLPISPQNDDGINDQPNRPYILWGSLVSATVISALLWVFYKRRARRKNKLVHETLRDAFDNIGWELPAGLNHLLLWMSLQNIEKQFHIINISLQWLGEEQPLHATAVERATVLQKTLPSANDAIKILLHEHQSALFSQNGGDEKLARHAAWNILFKTMYARLKFFFMGYN